MSNLVSKFLNKNFDFNCQNEGIPWEVSFWQHFRSHSKRNALQQLKLNQIV